MNNNFFTITFYKHDNNSIHCIASITEHSIVGKRMADGIYEKGCLLYESCWVKATPMGHYPWGVYKPANLLFDDNSQGQMVYGLIKGVLATLGIFAWDEMCLALGSELVKLENGKTLEKEFTLEKVVQNGPESLRK